MADVSGKAKAVHTTWRYRHPNWQCDCPGPATISGRLTGRGVLQLKRTRVVGHCSLRSRTSSPAMSFHPIVDRVSRLATNLVPASSRAMWLRSRSGSSRCRPMPGSITGKTEGTSAMLPCPERMTSPRYQVYKRAKLLSAPGSKHRTFMERSPCCRWQTRPTFHPQPTQRIPNYRILAPVLGSSPE